MPVDISNCEETSVKEKATQLHILFFEGQSETIETANEYSTISTLIDRIGTRLSYKHGGIFVFPSQLCNEMLERVDGKEHRIQCHLQLNNRNANNFERIAFLCFRQNMVCAHRLGHSCNSFRSLRRIILTIFEVWTHLLYKHGQGGKRHPICKEHVCWFGTR